MKKALSFAVALGLVAGMAYTASAADNLSISGDARWRGQYKNNFDGMDANPDRTQKMDQRYRVVGKIKVNDDVDIETRLVLADDVWQQLEARSAGADVALLKGFPANKLFDVIDDLVDGSD